MKANQIYCEILEKIDAGVWAEEQQLPTERALAEHYRVSRPTISRVLNRLRDDGRLRRVVGAGTFVTRRDQPGKPLDLKIGLFIPGLGKGEIFEPICAAIADISIQHDVTLIWGSIPADDASDRESRLMDSARRLIELGVDGVFLQPIEREDRAEAKNLKLVRLFDDAAVKVVLLDSDFLPFPRRSPYDLVGIDNFASAFQLCSHFLEQGARRVDFFWQRNTANTCIQRLMGYRQALLAAGIPSGPRFEHEGEPTDVETARALIDAGVTDLICANDETAALLMRSLETLGVRVPEECRIAGFDDVKYAHLARVPLTTIRQPCRQLAEVALETMIDRIAKPHLPPRLVNIGADLCPRASSRFVRM